jgi:hypothetical protein
VVLELLLISIISSSSSVKTIADTPSETIVSRPETCEFRKFLNLLFSVAFLLCRIIYVLLIALVTKSV